MADRRGLSQAMGMSADKLAFITGKAAPAAVAEPLPEPISVADAAENDVEPQESSSAPATAKARRPNRTRNASRQSDVEVTSEPMGLYGPIKVPLTIRLNPQTADALRRACLEQKLARRAPNSQQEIAEIAISGWLREYGYL